MIIFPFLPLLQALIWDASSGERLDNLKADSPVMDIAGLKINHKSFLTALTDTTLRLYSWNGLWWNFSVTNCRSIVLQEISQCFLFVFIAVFFASFVQDIFSFFFSISFIVFLCYITTKKILVDHFYLWIVYICKYIYA